MQSEQFEINLQNVIGPALYTHPIPEKIGQLYTNDIIRFFIPIDSFKSGSEVHPANMYGTNIYPINTPLPAVCKHQGIIFKVSSRPEETYEGWRLLNEFDEGYNVIRTERTPITNIKERVVGIDIILQITDIRTQFEGSRQYEIKTKSSTSLSTYAIAIIFGQPIYLSQTTQPNIYDNTFDMDLLFLLKNDQQQPIVPFYEGRKWYRFSLTGEPVECYDILDFCDEGLPFNTWVSQRLRQSTLYFDTASDRYEMAMMLSGDKIILKLSILNQPVMYIAQIRSDGTPIRQANKTILIEQIEWENVVWNEEGVTINDEYFGPIMSYFWAKRKRPLQ